MLEQSLRPKDIIDLLSKLGAETPEYPRDMLAARKTAIINQAVATNLDGPKQGGKGGGDGGSTTGGSDGSRALGGTTTAQDVLLQAVVGVGVIAGMLTTAYVFRGQITDLLQNTEIVVEITQAPDVDSPSSSSPAIVLPAPESPLPDVQPTEITSPSATPSPDTLSENETISDESSEGQTVVTEDPNKPKENQGLHLGQTPGAPDTPNQDKSNKPDKDKPGKNK